MAEETTLDPQNEATRDQSEVSTPESGRATETINSGSQDSQQTAPSQEEIDYKTRWQASSEEARRLVRERDEYQKRVEDLTDSTLRFVTRDRQTFEGYLDTQGLSQDEKQQYLTAYDSQYMAPPTNQAPPAQQTPPGMQGEKPAPQMDPYKERVLDEAADKLRRQVETRRMATQEFLENQENKQLSTETLRAIWPLAFKLETEDGLDPKTAIGRAKNIIVGQDDVQSEGYAQGLSDALLGLGSQGVSGGSQGSRKNDQLPPAHEQFVRSHIQNEGLEGKAAEDFRRRYVERLASKRII
jgi:hypothetical protein